MHCKVFLHLFEVLLSVLLQFILNFDHRLFLPHFKLWATAVCFTACHLLIYHCLFLLHFIFLRYYFRFTAFHLWALPHFTIHATAFWFTVFNFLSYHCLLYEFEVILAVSLYTHSPLLNIRRIQTYITAFTS